MRIGSGQDWWSDASECVTICHAVTRWVVLPTKCTRRYRVLSVVCFHTPTVRRAAHSIADGYETKCGDHAEMMRQMLVMP